MKDMNFSTDNASTLYVTNVFFYNEGNKPYTKMNFRESSYFKGESSESKHVKRTNVDANKKCFYCKKQRHMIKNCKTRIVAE